MAATVRAAEENFMLTIVWKVLIDGDRCWLVWNIMLGVEDKILW